MSFGYYPGCSAHATAKEYEKSMREVCNAFNIQLEEVEDWNCCGATPAHTTKEELGVALPYANIVNASKQGLENIIAPCAACYNRLKVADYEVHHSATMKERMNYIIGETAEKDLRIINVLEFFRDVYGLDKIKVEVKKPLKDLKVACYYGCLLVRPGKILQFDDEEDPTSMDELISALGGTPVQWSAKTECCGGSHAIPLKDVVLDLVKKILDSARIAGADCIAVACPLCQANLDMRQEQINKKYKTDFKFPILYITQLLGLALDIPVKNLGLTSQFISPAEVLKEHNLV
ncbi:MAG: heterodisulfide reductase subunit B [Ignavibacteriales bacterium]|nr:MAG: heterodisulfide reductase subunit B [Ignavibacteriales bacterium]